MRRDGHAHDGRPFAAVHLLPNDGLHEPGCAGDTDTIWRFLAPDVVSVGMTFDPLTALLNLHLSVGFEVVPVIATTGGVAAEVAAVRYFHVDARHLHEEIGRHPHLPEGPLDRVALLADTMTQTAPCRTGTGRPEPLHVGQQDEALLLAAAPAKLVHGEALLRATHPDEGEHRLPSIADGLGPVPADAVADAADLVGCDGLEDLTLPLAIREADLVVAVMVVVAVDQDAGHGFPLHCR